MTNSYSDTASPPPENHAIYAGDCNSVCSVDDFLAHMPESESPACREFARTPELRQLRVFCHPIITNGPNRRLNRAALSAAAVNAKVLSVQEKMKSLLLALRYEQAESIFVQFWTPTKTSSGRMMLSVLGQPFGMGNLCNGFCKYRYLSMEQGIQLEKGNIGPVGRVFTRRSPEHCASIESYSMEEFPMRDHAEFCGTYLALPVYHCGQQQACIGPVGVLEFLSRESRSLLYPVVLMQLKNLGLICTHACRLADIDEDKGQLINPTLLSLTKKHKLPLVQIWTPHYCHVAKKYTRLFCDWTSSPEPFHGNVGLDFARGNYFVDIGKGLVGRAWLQNKTCFLGETSQLSISDYPLVHVTRSSSLTSCFAIPLQSISPSFNCLVLEVFFPPQNNCHHDYVGDLLKSMLSAMAQRPECNQYIPFQINENKEFCVQYSHSDGDKFLYFDVYENLRTVSNGKALGNGRKGHRFQPLQKKDDGLLNSVESSGESSANEEAESHDGDQVRNQEIIGSNIREKDIYPAEKVKVGRSTPTNKRKEVQNIQPTHGLQEPEIGTFPNKKAKENEATDSNFITGRANGKSTARGNDEITRVYRIIVEANYRDDLAKFFLWSNLGIEGLHKELHKRFKLEVDKFSLKYKDDVGRWIILSCDEDLLFPLETSKTPGQTVLQLSVLPATL